MPDPFTWASANLLEATRPLNPARRTTLVVQLLPRPEELTGSFRESDDPPGADYPLPFPCQRLVCVRIQKIRVCLS